MRGTLRIARTLSAFLASLLLLLGSASAQAPSDLKAERSKRPPFSGADPALRKGLFEAWKASHGRPDPLRSLPESIRATLATSTVARPSLVINSSGQVLFSKQFPPNSCDPDPGRCGPNGGTTCAQWAVDNSYNKGDIVRPLTGGSYTVLFQAQNAGLSGLVEPNWPTTAGQTVLDGGAGGVTWLAIGFDPTMFTGCSAMQLILRAPGGGETVIAQEGDNILGVNLLGWGEFYAMNDGGVAAFKAPVAGVLDEGDEASVALFTAGPGPGSITPIAATGQVIGGLRIWGISPMVNINNSGQVLFDGYSQDLHGAEAVWKGNTAYAAGDYVMPSVPTQLEFRTFAACVSGSVEPVWPTRPGLTINDGSCVWSNDLIDGDETKHNLIRYTPGTGNQLLMGTGTDVGAGVTVTKFGDGCGACEYDNIDGFLNALGHTSTVVTLSTFETAAYLVTGPLTFTEVARTNGLGPGGFFFGTIHARTSLNDSDKVLFLADLNNGSARTPVLERQDPKRSPAVGSGTSLLRWTAPSTYDVVASVGDDIGMRTGGATSGETITAIDYFGDINNPGNVVFQATLSSGPGALYFWDASTGLLSEIARESLAFPAKLMGAMATINDVNAVAFTSGNTSQEGFPPDEGGELDMKGLHFWTKSGGVQDMIKVGVGGVSAVNAQHPNFRKRYLNSSSCVAVQYFVGGVSGNATQDEGEGSGPGNVGIAPAGQLFTSCGVVCSKPPAPVLSATPSTIGIGSTVTLTWTSVMAAGQGTYTIRRFLPDLSQIIIASGISSTGAPTQTFNYTDPGPLGSQSFEVEAIMNCDPTLTSFSNRPGITVTNCITPQPPPSLGINSPILPQGAVATLTWDAPFGFTGTYTLLYSVDNGATFNPFASGLTITGYAFTVQFPVGTTVLFEVVADAGCGPTGLSAPSPTVSLRVVQTCPAVKGPVDQEDRQQVAVGDTWSLHWTSTLPSGLGGPAGVYDVQISEDLGVSFHSVGTTTNTSFTGPPVPQADLGKIVFLQVIARPSCNPENFSAGFGNVVFFVVVPGCEAPEAARNASIEAASVDGKPIDRPPFPTEPLSLSWDAPLSGTPPTGYMIAINGNVPVLVTGGTGGIAPARGNADPVTLFVTSVACDPQKQGPTIQSPTVALLSQPPGASFSISPNPKAGQPVTFTDTSSPQATSWLWLFDDGSQSADQSPTKMFATAGTHTAALIATNGAGSGSAVQSFSVNAASSAVTVAAGSETVGFTAAQPGRRRVSVDVERPGALWLQLTSHAKQDTTLFLRFLDGSGNLVLERRMVVAQGASVTHDLAAFGLRGVYSIELVGDPSVGAKVVRTGRSTREVRR